MLGGLHRMFEGVRRVLDGVIIIFQGYVVLKGYVEYNMGCTGYWRS